ncbi:MAG: tyrosine-protein phosphatase [Pseudomonadota bacterium]
MVVDEKLSSASNPTVRRQKDGAYEITWPEALVRGRVSIFVGESPGTIDRAAPAAVVHDCRQVMIRGLEPEARHYFLIQPEGGPGLIAAERRVRLEGSVNFRDLGGYETFDGKHVKWGQVFRSDGLYRLSDRDRALLLRMGLRTVIDFRSAEETRRFPDLLPEKAGLKYLNLPMADDKVDTVSAMDLLKKGDKSWLTEDFMIQSMIRNVENFAGVWKAVLERLAAEQGRPLVFHCTGGKDRAGASAALILLALGVPEETVIEDHQLSNMFIAVLYDRIGQLLAKSGIDFEEVKVFFTAPRESILALLDHLRRNYGTPENYLIARSGLSRQTLIRLREELLE